MNTPASLLTVREQLTEVLAVVETAPSSRAKSIALTHLETAALIVNDNLSRGIGDSDSINNIDATCLAYAFRCAELWVAQAEAEAPDGQS